MLLGLVDEEGIALCVSTDKSEHHDGMFSRTNFVFDAENNRDVCRAGKYLKPAQRSQ